MKASNTILIIAGMGAFFIALALNLCHAANNYGVLDNKLHVEVLAQTNSSGGSSSGGSSSGGSAELEGPKIVSDIKCEIRGTLSNSRQNTQNNSTAWGFSGDFKVGGKVAGVDLGGNFDKKNEQGNTMFNLGSVEINVSFTSKMTMCQKENTSTCKPFDPCIEKLKEYRDTFQ